MNTQNQAKTRGCLGLDEVMNRAASSEASAHFGNAFREVLLAMRSVVDAVIESKAQKAEAKLQKVEVE